jgi:hypothetical protein
MRILLYAWAIAAGVSAQSFEAGLHGGVSRFGDKALGLGYSLGDGFRIGTRMTTNTEGFFGHEFGYAYNRTQLQLGGSQQGMAVHQGLYHFNLYANRLGARVRPFASGGAHFSNFTPPGVSAFQGGGDVKVGFNYGAGIKARITDSYLIRFDFKQYGTNMPFNLGAGGLLRQTEISVGFSFTM